MHKTGAFAAYCKKSGCDLQISRTGRSKEGIVKAAIVTVSCYGG